MQIQSTRTKLDVVNSCLGFLDMSTVVTSTDTHASRTLCSLLPKVAFMLQQEFNWIELVGDTVVNELGIVIDDTIMAGATGYTFPYSTRIHRVVDMENCRTLCFKPAKKFGCCNHVDFTYTADLLFITADNDEITVDSDGNVEDVHYFTFHRNTLFIPNTLNWGRFKVVHTKPITIPPEDFDFFELPEYLVELLELALTYRYAAMYSPARNDFAAARVSGLRDMYYEMLRTTKARHLAEPISFKKSIV